MLMTQRQVVMSDEIVPPKPEIRDQVAARALSGLCLFGLLDQSVTQCNCKATSRGLCPTHNVMWWRRFDQRRRQGLGEAYNKKSCRNGLILDSDWFRELKSNDPFVKVDR